jgi:hypothetical protein
MDVLQNLVFFNVNCKQVAAQIVEFYKSAVKVLDQGDNHPDG